MPNIQRVLRRALLLLIVWDSASIQTAKAVDDSHVCCGLADASGAVRFDYFRSSNQLDNRVNFYGLTTQLDASPSLTDTANAHITGRIINTDITGDGATQAILREGYVSINASNASLRVGKQIVAWGRADRVNPTDNLAPRDYTVLLPFDEDQRIGVASLTADWNFSERYRVSFFTTPYFTPSTVPLPMDISFSATIPAHKISNSEFGFKLTSEGENVDWSVSSYDGYNLLPSFSPGNALGAIVMHYDRIKVLGVDFATTRAGYGLRGEMARTWTNDESGSNPFMIKPSLFYVLGVDHTYYDNLYVNLQWIGRYVSNFEQHQIMDITGTEAAAMTSILNGQQDRVSHGMTFRISDNWLNSSLHAELLLFVYFKHTNYYVRPLVTYEFTDNLKGTIGTNLYYGPATSFFGFLRSNSGLFAELRYSF